VVTELDVRAADDSFPAASRALTYCRQLVAEAVGSVGASGAALYSVDGTAVAALLVEGVRSDDTALERVALDVLREGRPLLAVADPSGKAAGASSLRLVGLPISMDDELIAVCVLERPGTAFETVGACSARLAGWVLAIALAADRLRIESALSGEVSALKRQLDAYALDFRATYLAERDRSQQLAAALAELERTYKATVRGLAIAVEAKDECTG